MDVEMQQLRRSKALQEIGYDAGARVLRVRFRHGGLYDYLDVAPEVFLGLLDSPHPWTEWHEEVLAHEVRRVD
ncbi:KTSC domain-containing protein [Nocardioides humi]|uniref:KTSC domain-containing protein n=1 Tax=Nocardioides humi TaxID=449461 RepID=A0ABN2BGP3_9ACTN|nr:KTSC domain-containing protein [Nocardioides humi]